MHDRHFLSRAASVWVRRKSTLAVAAGGLLALLVWTIPNWGTFWGHLSQFPVLWQIPANRQSMVSLVIKILSPLLIMGMITLLLWIFSLVRMEVEEPEEPRQMGLPEAIALVVRFSQSFFTHMQQKAGPDQAARFSGQPAQPLSQQSTPQQQSAAPSRRIDPVTPLPPVMPSAEALRGQFTVFGRTNEASSHQGQYRSNKKEAKTVKVPFPQEFGEGTRRLVSEGFVR